MFAITLAALCLGCRSSVVHADGQHNILLNGDLTKGTSNSPDNWQSAAWLAKTAVFRWNHPAGAPGELEVSTDQPNDAHWSQTLHLSPGWYHFSASMRAEGVPHRGGGAILYEFENGVGSEALYGTTNWQTVGFYLKAGSSGADVKLACRLGGFASLNTGKTFCRNLRVIAIDKPPPDATATFDLDLMHAQGSTQPPVAATSLTEAHDISPDAGTSQASFGETFLERSLDVADWAAAFLVLVAVMFMIVFVKARAFAKERSQAGGWWQDGDQAIAIGRLRWLWKRDANIQAATSTARRGTAAESLSAVTAGFFMFALVLACVRVAPIAWFKSGPGYLAFFAAAIAVAGLAVRSNQEDARPQFRLIALSPEGWSTLAVFCGFLAFYAVTGFAETGYNEQVRQAVAFLHGHTYIDAPEHSYIEYAQVGPYKYALHPPLAPIVLMPLALIVGMQTPQTAFSVFVGALDVALAWRLLGRFTLKINARVWLTIFFGAGTVLWYETIQGTTWALPMIVAVFFTLATLLELFGKARPILLGAFAGLASLARYDLALCAPVLAGLAYLRGRGIKELFWMTPGFAAASLIFVGLNEARFHSFFDMGVLLTAPQGRPAFSVRYLPGNVYTIFFMGPGYDDRFPYIHPNGMGQALTLTSPAFVLALRANCRRPVTLLVWLAALLGSLASLLCYANGFSQFGTRHYIQVFPFLLVLMALGVRRRADQFMKILIATSIALVTFGIWHIHMWGFG